MSDAPINKVKQTASNPYVVGLGFVFVWMHTMTGQLRDHAGLVWVAAFYACLSLFMVALVLLDKRDARTRSMLSPTAVIAGLCLGLAPLMLLDLELAVPVPMHPLVVCLMGGYGIAHAYRSWSTPYSEMAPKESCKNVALALVIACLLELAMFLLGDVPTCILTAVVGIAIPTTLHLCYKRLSDEELAATSGKGKSFRENAQAALPMWRIAVGITVYSFAMGVSWTLLLSNPDYTLALTNIVTVLIVIALVAAYWIVSTKVMKHMSFRAVWRSIVLLMSAAILVAPQVQGLPYELVVSFVRAAQTTMASLWFLVLADIARRIHVDPSHVVSMGWVFYSLPIAAGVVFGFALVPIDPLHTVLPALTVLALVAIAFLVDDDALPQGRFFAEVPAQGTTTGAGTINDVTADAARAGIVGSDAQTATTDGQGAPESQRIDDGLGSGMRDRLTVRCRAISRDYSLTNREFDVLVFLAHGRSGAFIAEKLTLSENTVKGHTKRLYAKLGVHNRQELINLAENYEIKV